MKTPAAHQRAEALNAEIKRLLDTGGLRAFTLFHVPADTSAIKSTRFYGRSPTSTRQDYAPVETRGKGKWRDEDS